MSTIRRKMKALKDAAGKPGGLGLAEDGAALITALMFLLILTALGLASIMTSSTEVMISGNDRLNKLALDYANAGLQAAMAQLDKDQLGDPAKAMYATGGPWNFGSDSAYLSGFINYSALMNFDGTVKLMTENDTHWRGKGEATPVPRSGYAGNDEVVGYCVSCGYDNSPVQKYEKSLPVYTITSRGWVGDSSNPLAEATVTADVTKNTINVDVRSPLDASCLSALGNVTIHGQSNCNGVTDNKSPYTTQCYTTITGGSYSDDGDGGVTVPDPVTGAAPQTAEERLGGMSLADLKSMAIANNSYYQDQGTAPSHSWFPLDPATPIQNHKFNDPSCIVYIQPNAAGFTVTANGSGEGILVIDGDFTVAGTFTWDGLVYVTGNLNSGTGTATFNGGIIIDGALSANTGGNLTINYDCDALEAISRRAFQTRQLNWVRVFN